MADFGSQNISNYTATPYSDATQTKKQPRDKIKRPMNAFILWSQIQRKKLVAGATHHAEVSKQLGHQWRQMTTEQKNPFYEKASLLRDLHNKEFPDYKYKPKKKNVSQSKSVRGVSDKSKSIRKRSLSSRSVTTTPVFVPEAKSISLHQYSPESPESDIADAVDSDILCSTSISEVSDLHTQSGCYMTPAATPSPCSTPTITNTPAYILPCDDYHLENSTSFPRSLSIEENGPTFPQMQSVPGSTSYVLVTLGPGDTSMETVPEYNVVPESAREKIPTIPFPDLEVTPDVSLPNISNHQDTCEEFPHFSNENMDTLLAMISSSELSEHQFDLISSTLTSSGIDIQHSPISEEACPTSLPVTPNSGNLPQESSMMPIYVGFRGGDRQCDPVLTSASL